MNVLDLFSGIGGFSLGLERAGMTTVGFCEIEQYPISILKKHWPDIPVFNDIKEVKGDEILQQVGQVDLICGGFPCQPFSVAGKQRGSEDDRHLWPHMLRLISEIRPRWIIAENVAGFIPMGLDTVLSDLEAESYATQSFVIPACAVGGVHRRDRVWIVAYTEQSGIRCQSESTGMQGRFSTEDGTTTLYQGKGETGSDNFVSSGNDAAHTQLHGHATTEEQGKSHDNARTSEKGANQTIESERICISSTMADTESERPQGKPVTRSNETMRQKSSDQQSCGFSRLPNFRPIQLPTQPAVCHRDNGISNRLARLKALGNSVVPQIPEMIGRAIMAIEEKDK